jgi:outer membrane protein assembly factor BamB
MKPMWKNAICLWLILCSAQIVQSEKIARAGEGVAVPAARNGRDSDEIVGPNGPWIRTGGQPSPKLASDSELLFVNPNVVNLLPGEGQPLQLLDAAGVVVTDVEWSVVDSSVAGIMTDGGGEPVRVMAKGVGQTRIVGTSLGRSAYCELTVFSSGTRPNGVLRWAAPALPGTKQDLGKVVQSLRMDDKTPDLYVGDGVRIRAFNQDGQEQWVWPVAEGPRSVRLLAGDDRGGAVALATDGSENSIVCVDSKGHQVWVYHLTSQFKLSDYAIDLSGLVYLLEDQPQGPSQVVALEPDTGQIRFTISVPMSSTEDVNWEKREIGGKTVPVCASGNKTPNRRGGPLNVASAHGKLVITSDNNAYLPVLVQSVVFDGLPCESASNLNQSQVLDTHTSTLRYSATLEVMQIHNDGTHSFIDFDSASYVGPDWRTPVLHFGSSERAIPDGNDNDELLFPSIVSVGSLYGDGLQSASRPEGRIYRFTRTASTHFPVPLLPGAPYDSDSLLIGEHSRAFVMGTLNRVPAVAGFNFDDGSGKWLTPAPYPEGSIAIESVMADDSLVFMYLHDAHTRLMITDPHGNVFPFLPFDLAGPTGSNGPSYWTLGTWFVFLNDQSLARVSRTPL